MGCGQSKIHLYPRKSKSKANGKKGGHVDSDAETDEDEGHVEDTEKYQSRECEKNEEADEQSNKDLQETDEDVSVSLLRAKNLSLLQSQEISSSQQNFFRMLDRKIEEGPDYDSASETEIALEEARLNALVQHWESASLTASICSSASRSLQTTPIRQAPIKQLAMPRSLLQQNVAPAQQQMSTTDFLPHGASQSTQLPASTSQMKQSPGQHQVALSHMNTTSTSKVLHHQQMVLGGSPQMPMSNMITETTATTAITSNALAILQASPNQSQQQQQQFSNLLNLPGAGAGSPQLLGKPNVSPKRIIDARLLMNPSPIVKQMQQPQIQCNPQFMSAMATNSPPAPSSLVNGGRSPQPPIPPLQMTYYGQPTAQQNIQATIQQHEQQQQHMQQPIQGQSQPYYGDIIHSVQAPMEYRFPPAISVQRLAPQVQRQLRETQELIKDSCPQLYAAGYGSPGPPIRNQTRNTTRRPTLETQFSQELS